jgi:hypothetical protein
MPNAAPKATTGSKIVAGLIAVGLCTVLIASLVTGDFSNGRIDLSRSSDPLFFWMRIGLLAVGAVCAALFAVGLVDPKPPARADYVAHVRSQTTSRFVFLLLIGAAGSGYFWISEWLENSQSVISGMAGWLALCLLGLAAWPPVLPPGQTRTVLRALGTAAIVVAATMIFRLAY